MKSNSDDMLDHLICSYHGEIRLVLYCIRCEKPICIDGLVESHNGHFVKKLSTAYKELVHYYEEQKDKIQNELLPKYRELSVNEDARKVEVKNSFDEIENEINSHTEKVISMVEKIGTLAIWDLHIAGSEELQKFINFKSKIDKGITKLYNLCKLMSANIEGKPEISFFKPIKSNDLEVFQKLPTIPHHKFSEFQPGKINKLIHKELSDAVKTTDNRKEGNISARQGSLGHKKCKFIRLYEVSYKGFQKFIFFSKSCKVYFPFPHLATLMILPSFLSNLSLIITPLQLMINL